MTPEFLTAFAAIVLSAVFSFVPIAKDWYAKFDKAKKQLVMILLLALSAIVITGLSCTALAEYMAVTVPCSTDGIIIALRSFALAVFASYSFYGTTKYLGKSENPGAVPQASPLRATDAYVMGKLESQPYGKLGLLKLCVNLQEANQYQVMATQYASKEGFAVQFWKIRRGTTGWGLYFMKLELPED